MSYNEHMKLTLQIQLLPTEDQKVLLLNTIRQFNAAASFAAKVGFSIKKYSAPGLHHPCYFPIREKFGLSAQMTTRAIAKACEAFSQDKNTCPVFKPTSAITYDDRLMSFKGLDRVSLLTLGGRQIIPIVFGEYQRARFDRLKGQCDLVHRRGKFYLICTIDLPENPPIEIKAFVGVDLGIAKIISTSDGDSIEGSAVEGIRRRYLNTRRNLGKKMSHKNKRRTRKNARRAMKRIGDKESRFRRHQNHVISKTLVDLCKGTHRGIAIEDLKGIRGRTRFRKSQRAKMGGWSFFQLRSFIEYKGKLNGVPVVTVNPRNTSRTCSKCNHCDKANRQSQSEFKCRLCGHTANADHNAAINIAAAASVVMLEVSEKHRDPLAV